jgi:hypothetical protein
MVVRPNSRRARVRAWPTGAARFAIVGQGDGGIGDRGDDDLQTQNPQSLLPILP